jgi:two-component system response regulator RegX3
VDEASDVTIVTCCRCGHGTPLPGLCRKSKDQYGHQVKTDISDSHAEAIKRQRRPNTREPSGTISLVKPRILVVEDEQAISEPLAESLQREGFDPEVAPTLAVAREACDRQIPDLILLDVMLPDGDGRDLARDIRKLSDVPIIMLTARGEEIDRVLGLELGADDYVVKPFSVRELTARIRAIMRRGKAPERRTAIEVGGILLDPASRSVTKAGRTVEMAAREFDLLHLLMANAGEVLRREQIMDEVWDPHWFGPTKTLDVHISWLRKKLEDDPARPRYITTVRGVGFRFASADDVSSEDTSMG